MKKHTKKVRKKDKRTLMGRVGALVCVLMLCITLPTVAFAEEPFGNVIQQTQMEEVIESEQPVTDTADSTAGNGYRRF